MRIAVTFPGARATGRDLYYRVHIEPDGSPLRYEFSYGRIGHDDGRHELVCMESGLVQTFEGPREADENNLAPVTAAAVRDFKEQWTRYERAANVTLQSALGEENFTARPRERRELSDEFLRDILQRHREHQRHGRQGTAAIAREERVGTSTVRNWLRKAREAGIEEESRRAATSPRGETS
jgi:hypothetical protein